MYFIFGIEINKIQSSFWIGSAAFTLRIILLLFSLMLGASTKLELIRINCLNAQVQKTTMD